MTPLASLGWVWDPNSHAAGFGAGSGLGSGGSEMGLGGSARLSPVAENRLGFPSRTRLKTFGSSRWSNHLGRKRAGLGLRERRKGCSCREKRRKKENREIGWLRESWLRWWWWWLLGKHSS